MALRALREEILEIDMLDVDHPIRVLDADGFIHDIDHVSWDPDDKCFYVHTKFMPQEAAPSV